MTPLDDANFTRSVRLDLNQTYSPNPIKKGFTVHLEGKISKRNKTKQQLEANKGNEKLRNQSTKTERTEKGCATRCFSLGKSLS